ncbi:GNAT family N-acetyltransferase [Actinocorallia lasiicapitis]
MIGRASTGDAGEILTLQRAAYVAEAQLYGDPFLPPLVETLDQAVAVIAGDSLVLKQTEGGRITGAVRATFSERTCLIGRLVVAPDRQGAGIGTALLKAIEAEVAERTDALVLFTGHQSIGNLRLYKRLGFAEFRRERINDHLVHVHLRKELE